MFRSLSTFTSCPPLRTHTWLNTNSLKTTFFKRWDILYFSFATRNFRIDDLLSFSFSKVPFCMWSKVTLLFIWFDWLWIRNLNVSVCNWEEWKETGKSGALIWLLSSSWIKIILNIHIYMIMYTHTCDGINGAKM